MAKDKKKKKDKKAAKTKSGGTVKALTQNPLVADIVAAALVATASALKDSKRARALASDAGDELAKLSKAGTRSGEALWDMALQIGRRSLESLAGGNAKPKRTKRAATKVKSPAKPAKKAARKKSPAAPRAR